MKGVGMTSHKMRGAGLYNAHDRKIAMTRGESIYDAGDRRIGAVHGDDLFDTEGRIMMHIRGHNIYDAENKRVAALSEAQESIDGAVEGNLRAALWYCFVR
jgi:hypothetical protein